MPAWDGVYHHFVCAGYEVEVPAHIITLAEVAEQRREQEKQAAKEARSRELEKPYHSLSFCKIEYEFPKWYFEKF